MHKKAHGLIPHKILEVSQDIVESFLGRIHDPEDVIVTDSFASAAGAVGCGLDIGSRLPENDRQKDILRLAVSGGDPAEGSDRLFGDALQLARRLCNLRTGGRVALSVSVKNLLEPDFYPRHGKQLTVLA